MTGEWNMGAIEMKARRMAIQAINAGRASAGLPPRQRIPPRWWIAFGAEWMKKAAQQAGS